LREKGSDHRLSNNWMMNEVEVLRGLKRKRKRKKRRMAHGDDDPYY
jgi:hypothetical protein